MGLNTPQLLAQLARSLVVGVYTEPLPMAWQIGPEVAALAIEAAKRLSTHRRTTASIGIRWVPRILCGRLAERHGVA